jgi:tetratricopeptide (TPR) repeat protein
MHVENAFAMAGNCYVRAADCRKCLANPDGEAELLVQAGEAYARGDDRRCKLAAVTAMRSAVRVYENERRPAKAAKIARQAAEFAVDGGMAMEGVTLLHYAANVFLTLKMSADARACLARATAVTVMDAGNYVEAIACLEKLADLSPSNKEQSYALFRATVVRMVCIPSFWGCEAVEAINDCRDVFSAYIDACPALLNGAENECITRAIRGLLAEDLEIIEAAFGKYVRSHTLEEWVEPMFWAIHGSATQRKSQHVRLYTL